MRMRSSPNASEELKPAGGHDRERDGIGHHDRRPPTGPLLLRIYTPDRPHGPALVWVHGGAYAFGDVSMPESDWVSRQLAERGVAVVAVDYRLSPTISTSPMRALRPAVTGCTSPSHPKRWSPPSIGCSPTRINSAPILSSSSSAGVAREFVLALSAMLRPPRRGEQHPRAGLLVYPSVHAVVPPLTRELEAGLGDLPPILRFSPEVMRVIHLNYVGDEAELANPYAFPGGHDLRGLPPVFILNSTTTPCALRVRLWRASCRRGRRHTGHARSGTRHGHLNSPDEPLALRSLDRMAAWVHGGPLGVRHEASRT